jgi:uncharacterized protein YkwD
MTTPRIALLASVVVGAAALFVPRTTATPAIREANTFEAGLMWKVNATRRAHGLPPLRRSQALDEASSAKSHALVRLGYFAHTRPDGTSFWREVLTHYPQIGSGYWRVGENLAWGTPTLTPALVVRRWLASPPHRANVLSSRYRELGIGAVRTAGASGYWAGRGDVVVIASEFGVRR